MDATKTSKCFQKKLLSVGSPTLYKISQVKKRVFLMVACSVQEYAKLKLNSTYRISLFISSYNIGDLILLKTRKALVVKLRTIYDFEEVHTNIKCKSESVGMFASQRSKELFEAEFPNSVVADLTLEDREKCCLDIECYCSLDHKNNKITPYSPNLTKEASLVIHNHICSLTSLHPKYEDFLIITHDEVFPAQKAILAARSKYFEEYFKKESNTENSGISYISLDIDSRTMTQVMSYIYNGCFIVKSFKRLSKIFKMSVMFKIQGLQKLCIEGFVHKLCSKGLPKMLQTTKEMDLAKLLSNPEKFLLSDEKLS